MSSDTLLGNFPFIRSSIEYFIYRLLVRWGPISNELFTVYAFAAGNDDCRKYSANEMKQTERPNTCRFHCIFINICLFVFEFEMKISFEITVHRHDWRPTYDWPNADNEHSYTYYANSCPRTLNALTTKTRHKQICCASWSFRI